MLQDIDDVTWSTDSQFLYFRGNIDHPKSKNESKIALYRVRVTGGKFERVADLENFETYQFSWYGLDPDNMPLGLKGKFIQELYLLRLRR